MNAQYQKNHQDLMSTMKTFTGMAMKQHYTLATPMKKPDDHFTGVSPAADYYDEQIFQMRVIAAQSMGLEFGDNPPTADELIKNYRDPDYLLGMYL